MARQPARQETVDGAVSTPDTSDGEGAMDDEEAVTSTKKLHEVGIHSHCEIHMLMRLRGGVASRRKPREQVEFNQEPCHIRQSLHLLCPPTCRCGNSLQAVEEKAEVIRGYGLNASGAELIATRDIARGDVVAVFGKTATLRTSKDVHECQELVDATNDDPCGTDFSTTYEEIIPRTRV